jgi:hypothetical protein
MLTRQEGPGMKILVAICVAALAGVAYASDAATTGAPIATTGIAQPGDWFAFLHGTVDPNGEETTVWFEWGRTPELGTATTPQTVHPGGEVELADAIYGLESFEVYYFRFVAENASGRALGETVAFRTLDTIIPPPKPPPPPTGPPPAPSRPTCLVPKVVGRQLARAKKLIRKSGCRVGRIRKARSARGAGTVLSQVPRGGIRVPLRAHVRLVVSRG